MNGQIIELVLDKKLSGNGGHRRSTSPVGHRTAGGLVVGQADCMSELVEHMILQDDRRIESVDVD